ncbi:MAG: trypsin-like serine protease [FCB group bacterium]|nr:trypsin-like serine protease [FCB group bacterium]
MPKFRFILFLSVVGTMLWGQTDISLSRETALTQAIRKVSPAVASINVIQLKEYATRSPFNDPFFQYFFPYQLHREQVKSSGTGVVISPDGYVLTNNHVVEDALKILVTLPGGEEHQASVVGTDKVTDVALLKLDGSDYPYAELGNSDDLMIGEWAIALGNPYGLFDVNKQPTATAGIISAVNLDFGRQESGQVYQDMIQTDASINPGNSGGPLVNSMGQVIGINTFIFTGSSRERGSVGIGFAIPINRAREIAEELKNSGRIDRSFSTGLQVQPLNRRIAEYLGIPFSAGVIIVDISDNSAAEKAGLEAADVITEVEGTKVTSARDIFDVIEEEDLRPGDKVRMRIYRDGRYKTLNMKLGKVDE